MSSFVVRTDESGYESEIFESLKSGLARIGWSSDDSQNLRTIIDTVNERGRQSLSSGQQQALRCRGFADRACEGDLLFYPNVPEYGEFVVAKLLGDYEFLDERDSIDGDFRSARRCRLLTSKPISKYNRIVHPLIRVRLGLQGRFYQLYADQEVGELLRDLPDAGTTTANVRSAFSLMKARLAREMGQLWSQHFPRTDLTWFLEDLFRTNGYSVVVKEGPNERGSDLLLQVEEEFLPEPIFVGIQVGSYEGEVSPDKVREKLDQLLRGWDEHGLHYGVLVLTGNCGEEARSIVRQHNENDRQRQVKLIDGGDLARIVLNSFERLTLERDVTA
jgi:hypothetical protein